MVDDAASKISENVWGALLILSWVIFAFVYRELKKELKDERTSHQETRIELLAGLKSNNHVSAGLLAIQDEQKRQNSMILDALQRRAG